MHCGMGIWRWSCFFILLPCAAGWATMTAGVCEYSLSDWTSEYTQNNSNLGWDNGLEARDNGDYSGDGWLWRKTNVVGDYSPWRRGDFFHTYNWIDPTDVRAAAGIEPCVIDCRLKGTGFYSDEGVRLRRDSGSLYKYGLAVAKKHLSGAAEGRIAANTKIGICRQAVNSTGWLRGLWSSAVADDIKIVPGMEAMILHRR